MVTVEMLRISGLVQGAHAYLVSGQRLLVLLEVGLVIIIAVISADIVAGFLGDRQGQQVDTIITQAPVSRQGAARTFSADQKPTAVLKTLFGVPLVASVGSSLSEQEIQETRLGLKLKGILVKSPSGLSLALIARSNNAEEIYRVGDEIEDAEIIRIEPRRVVLRRNGQIEALSLEIAKPGEKSNTQAARGPAIGFNGIRQLSDNDLVISQQLLRQQLNNLPRLLQQATAVPHSVNGQAAGFKLVEIKNGTIFERLGLKAEDVIQSVNGKSIYSPEDALNAYRDLRTSRSFQLSILRAGRPMTLNLTVQ